MTAVKSWHRLPREAVDGPSLETFKVRLDGLWAIWSSWRCPCSLKGVWTRWPLKVSCFQAKLFYDSMICRQVAPRGLQLISLSVGWHLVLLAREVAGGYKAFNGTQILWQRGLCSDISLFSRGVKKPVLHAIQYTQFLSAVLFPIKYSLLWVTRFSLSCELTGTVFAWSITDTMRLEAERHEVCENFNSYSHCAALCCDSWRGNHICCDVRVLRVQFGPSRAWALMDICRIPRF